MRSNLAKVLLILLVLVATVAALTACAPGPEEDNPEPVLESIDIEGGSTISIEEGAVFDPSAYTLIAELSDDSRIRVQMSAGMFTEEELEYLNNVGVHALKVSYSLNGVTKDMIFTVEVVARVIEPTKYTVKYVMPVYDDKQYGKQLQDSFVSTLNKPFIEPNEDDPTYLSIEWYTRDDFAPNTEVSFPLQLTANNTVDGVLTIYGKAIDSRKINVRYFQRTVTQNNSSVSENPFYSDPNKYSYGDNHRTLSHDGVISYNNGVRTGYDDPYFEIYNYQTEAFERLEFNTDFKIENKYIEPSKLSDEEIDVAVETVYNISRFTVLLQADKNFNGTIDNGEEFYLTAEYNLSTEKCYFYYNSTLSASSIPTAHDDLQVIGKSLSWKGYQLAGYDTIYVTGDLVLSAVYSDVTYDVWFYRAVSGNPITSFSVPYGATVGSQVTPTKQLPTLQSVQGYTFTWEYYLDSDDNRYEINNDAIADITVRGVLRVYETRTANVYNSTFKYISGSATPFETTEQFSFADSVTFPTVSELKTAMPVYDYEYFSFEWFLEQPVESSIPVNISSETQRAADTVYYLRVSDMRRLTATVVLPAEFSRAGKAIEREFGPAYFDTGSSKPSSINIEVSSFAFDIIESHQYNALYTNASRSDRFDGETVRFNKDFWTHFASILYEPDGASDDGYFDYGLKLYMGCAVRTFEVVFYEQIASNTIKKATTTVKYGESPVKPSYNTSDRIINGETYSFYGWYSMPDDINSYVSDTGFATMETKRNLEFYAKWLSAKEGTYGVIYEEYNGYYAAVDYQGSADEVRIATEINGKVVNGIAAELFFWSDVGSEVKAVYLHSGITFVEQGAFTPCNSLENIFVNGTGGKYSSDNGVLYMDNGDGTTLTLVKYPTLKNPNGSYTLLANTTVIADEAFAGYRGTGINFGSTLETIGARAFIFSTSLQSVILPASLVTIGEQAFYDAKNLATVTAEGNSLANIEKFGSEVFDGTAWLEAQTANQIILGGVLLTVKDGSSSITLDDGVRVIADAAFVGLKATLTSFTVTADSDLEIIGARAFEGCSLLSDVTILSTGDVVAVDGNSFKTTASGLRVTVAAEKLNDYRQSSDWRSALGDTSTVIISA